jgi:hypothetical protein
VKKIIKLTLFLFLISIFHSTTYLSSGGWIFSGSSYYQRGFPFPWITFKVNSFSELTGDTEMVTNSFGNVVSHNISIMDVVTHFDSVSFELVSSLVGTIMSMIFWFIISIIVHLTWKNIKTPSQKILLISSIIITIATVALPSVDLSNNIVIERGAPLPYLLRLHLAGGTYSQFFYFKPYLFFLDFLIIGQTLAITYLLITRIKKLFVKDK